MTTHHPIWLMEPDEWESQQCQERDRWLAEYDATQAQIGGEPVDTRQMFPSKYIKSGDVPIGQEYTLTINRVVIEDLGTEQAPEQKPIVYFERSEKGMVLNRTNCATLEALYGYDTDGWTGKPIIMFSMMVQGPNGIVPGLRLKPAQLAAAKAALGGQPVTAPAAGNVAATAQTLGAPAMPPAAPVDFDDDIPF